MNTLHQAIIYDDLQTIAKFSDHSALLNACNSQGFSVLELAHLLGRKEALKLLLPNSQKSILLRGKKEMIRLSEEEFYQYFNVVYRSHLRFADYAFLQKTLQRCPYLLSKTSLGNDNRKQAKLFEKELQAGFVADVFIAWIDDLVGHGLFALQDLPKGSFVAEFTGQVRRLYRLNADHNAYCFHYPTCFASWQYTVIDALLEGNESRFINHSENPNLTPLCLLERNLLHIVFVTNSEVKAGAQLTYNYGPSFWRFRQKS